MLHSIFPKVDHKFLSMPLLGPVADGFDDWLAANGYTRSSRKHAMQVLRHIDLDLRRRRISEVAKLTHAILDDCWRDRNKLFSGDAGTVRTLARYLITNSMIAVADTDNNRVLIWSTIPTSNGVPADVVVGQPDFTHNSIPGGNVR